MIPTRRIKSLGSSIALLALCMAAGCALANHPSGAPLDGSGTMPANPCVSPDYPLGEMTPTDPHLRKLTTGVCGADYVVEGAATEISLPVGAGKVRCDKVTGFVHYTEPEGMALSVALAEKNWVARPGFDQASTAPLPPGSRKSLAMQTTWSCDADASQSPVIRIFGGGKSMQGLVIHRWWVIPRAAPRGAPVVMLRGVDEPPPPGPEAAGRR